MATPTPETVWNANEKELHAILESGACNSKPRTIRFYAPSFMPYKSNCFAKNCFPTFSVTGKNCALNCKHCGGKLLGTMQITDTPEKLLEAARRLKSQRGVGCLISGGCDPTGSVPLDKFIPIIAEIKHEMDLTIIVHTGIIDSPTATALKKAGVDAALIDIIGADETIVQTCNLKLTTNDYENSLKALKNAGLSFVPHVVVGLQNGKLLGELQALKNLSKFEPTALVIIAFIPIHGTVMERAKPPLPWEIAKVVALARLMFPKTPLALGCMRPKGKLRSEIDRLSLKAGVDAIAFPCEEVIQHSEEQGYKASFSPYCCSQILMDAKPRSGSK